MRNRKIIALVIITLVLPFLLTGCAGQKNIKFKVGFIYHEQIENSQFVQFHNNARLTLEEQLGVTTLYKEAVLNTEDCIKSFIELEKEGCKVIFACDSIFIKYKKQIEEAIPKVKVLFKNENFIKSTSEQDIEILNQYNIKAYEARYLTGIIAGMSSNTKKLGFIAPFPVNECLPDINAFALGAWSATTNAAIEVEFVWDWNNKEKEKQLTQKLIDSGCDVLAFYSMNDPTIDIPTEYDIKTINSISEFITTESALEMIEEKTTFSALVHDILYSTPEPENIVDGEITTSEAVETKDLLNKNSEDMTLLDDNLDEKVLTTINVIWAQYYIDTVQAIMDETYVDSNYLGGIQNNVIELTAFSEKMDTDIILEVETARKLMQDGTLVIFKGPLNDQAGDSILKKGEVLTEEEIMNMSYLIENIIGDTEFNKDKMIDAEIDKKEENSEIEVLEEEESIKDLLDEHQNKPLNTDDSIVQM